MAHSGMADHGTTARQTAAQGTTALGTARAATAAVRPFSTQPGAQGLYDPRAERDACGVAFVATMRGEAGHDIVEHALTALRNLDHRGAVGAETDTGDGAGILTQVPDAFLREVLREETGVELPRAGRYAVGTAFLPAEETAREAAVAGIEAIAAEEGCTVLAWRDVPVTPDLVGASARSCMPCFRQVFLTGPADAAGVEETGVVLDRRAYAVRKRAERDLGVYFPSLSSRTLVYKGMLTTGQLEPFYPDLSDRRYTTELALVHSRFSTNTFPSWPLAHPFRLIAHNGEINTVRGNRNWMAARESQLETDLIPGGVQRLSPICATEGSDSASFDEVLELLHLSGRSLPHAVLMMIPEAWENHTEMDPAKRAFYEYHSMLMEPWDGPASVTFTDGTVIGAVLDRNGLRPSRYWITDEGLVVLASEVGVLDLDPASVVTRGRVQPGKMFLVDTAAGRIVEDEEVKSELAAQNPYAQWLADNIMHLQDLPAREHVVHTHASVARRQQTFGYTEEELRLLLAPMARAGAEPIGSMGSDTPLAVLSTRPRLLFDYFKQLFAQVTNPPLDAIREELVTSLIATTGPQRNLLSATPEHAQQLVLPFPVIDNDQLAKIVHIDRDRKNPGRTTSIVKSLYRVSGGGAELARRIEEIRAEVSQAIADGAVFVVLSDRDSTAELAPIPSLLITSAVHHHLVRQRTRTQVGLIVEAGDVREVHHVALLVGYGAAAINPYLAMETVEDMVRHGALPDVDAETAVRNLIKALGKGVLKVMSKMGISTVASYCGAQVFEALGLSQTLVDEYFTATTSRLGGVGLDVLAEEVARRHRTAYPVDGLPPAHRRLDTGGEYQWRRDGEAHLFDPETVFKLQHSTRTRSYDVFRQYTRRVDEQAEQLMTLRGLLHLRKGVREPVPVQEVEPVSSIVKRFSTGAMSYGSISKEAHEVLAIAMNRLGAKSNSGEGGEDVERLVDPQRRSAIKQIASGRFGVTSNYLANATDLQIKMAQGAKPGEGGQLPGHKVYPNIARTRHSTPGVGLISPPPHHDIYSIEDLAQLIHDLKNANRTARVHVKLVSEIGIGTVAAGVSKAKADVVLVSGYDGGTGAAPLTSLKHAGGPWELGLAETQQTLVLNGLRDRISVQVDGQLKTGRDVIIAALLGAEEFGFATAPLVVEGCIMMRVCHLDTCPVGIATQNPELRSRFAGQADHVVNFFEFLAQEVREYLATLGFRSLDEAIGHVELLDARRAVDHWKAAGLDLTPVLSRPDVPEGTPLRRTTVQDHGLEKALDHVLIERSREALEHGRPVRIELPVRNVNRTIGAMLGYEVTTRHGEAGLPDGTIDITLTGSGGQSLGAFLPRGVTIRLLGDTNDYVGKGLSGGRVIVRPDRSSGPRERNIVAGNVIGYGATSGELFLRGEVGERFCVRNSGATAVVEGVGDHGLEYMTGGEVVILGRTGRNLAAGMSGGLAHVLDLKEHRVNTEMVDLEPMDDAAAARVHDLLVAHREHTGSVVAGKLLADWGASRQRFTTVVPRDYRRVLEVRAAAAAEGLSPDDEQVMTRIMEASHG
ncbi:glutamate synthase (NADPH/NADH) large chain [Kineococcus xinjiangensis]|uniref:Glutamate synthase (NADPH/NADH) large chain n=1 Tax=Kineococcus xinjiangensis TaxID=512762 RepID=A0A2S6IP89_9ACTN|nr:glutamate synthase large subunit [Kineococcus xinjiangensis]PPK96074.1 glutamate synthase (NADPH/NADH) large chain [Kineococcus xinjiangensis]